MYGTTSKLTVITLLTAVLFLNPVTAQSEVTCLSDSSIETLDALAEDNPDVTTEDLRGTYEDLCQRDEVFHSFLKSDLEEFQEDMEDRIENRLSDAEDDLYRYVDNQLTDLNKLADVLEGLDEAIKNNVEVQNDIQNLSEQIDEVDQRHEENYENFRESFVTESRLSTEVNSTKNWATGNFQQKDYSVGFWDWYPFNKLYTFFAVALVMVGGYVGWKRDKLPEWVYQIDGLQLEGSELTKEEIEQIEAGVRDNEEEQETVEEEVSKAEESGEEELNEEVQKHLKELKKSLKQERKQLKGKGARRTSEDEERMEEIDEKIEDLELRMGV